MITTDELLVIFAEKLVKTGDFNQAFKKATWVAYKEGGKDERKKLDVPESLQRSTEP